jgi:hypothetical protein
MHAPCSTDSIWALLAFLPSPSDGRAVARLGAVLRMAGMHAVVTLSGDLMRNRLLGSHSKQLGSSIKAAFK